MITKKCGGQKPATKNVLVFPAGIEPTAFHLGGERSILLSYGNTFSFRSYIFIPIDGIKMAAGLLFTTQTIRKSLKSVVLLGFRP